MEMFGRVLLICLKGVIESELMEKGGRFTAVFSCCKLIQSPDSHAFLYPPSNSNKLLN